MSNNSDTTETPTSPPVEYFDWEQTEDYSRLSRTFLRRQIAAGHLAVIRVGGRVLIARDDLDQFLKSHRTTGQVTSGRGATRTAQKKATSNTPLQ